MFGCYLVGLFVCCLVLFVCCLLRGLLAVYLVVVIWRCVCGRSRFSCCLLCAWCLLLCGLCCCLVVVWVAMLRLFVIVFCCLLGWFEFGCVYY